MHPAPSGAARALPAPGAPAGYVAATTRPFCAVPAETWVGRVAGHGHLGVQLFPVVGAALFASTLRGAFSRRVLGNPWVATVGGMCCTIYLLHYPLISLPGRATGWAWVGDAFEATLLLQSALLLPPLLAVCAVCFAAVERPCVDPSWPARLWAYAATRLGRRTAGPAPEPPAAPVPPAGLAEAP